MEMEMGNLKVGVSVVVLLELLKVSSNVGGSEDSRSLEETFGRKG